MGTGTSIVLIAVGAILKWGVTAHVTGVALGTVGTILLVVGIVGLVIALLFTAGVLGRTPERTRDTSRTY